MLFRQHVLQGIAEGRVTLAFRRWRRQPPADGSSLRSPVGVIRLDRVTVIDDLDLTAADIARTGMSREELRASIAACRREARPCSNTSEDTDEIP